MAAVRAERRLAAILAADVVGYSALMERDEDRTLARLKVHRREFIEPLIAEYQGRIVKLMANVPNSATLLPICSRIACRPALRSMSP